MSIVLVAVMAAAAEADSRIIVMAEPDDAAAMVVSLAGRSMQVSTGASPAGEARFDRAAAAQHAALDGRAVAAVWMEDGEVCVVSADGAVFRHAPLPIDDRSPRVFATIAMSLLDELLAPPLEPLTVQVDVSIGGPGAIAPIRRRAESIPKFMVDGGGYLARRGMTFEYDPSSSSPPARYPASPISGVQFTTAAYPTPIRGVPMTGPGFTFAAARSVGSTVTAMDDTGYGDYAVNHTALEAAIHYRYPIDVVTLDAMAEYGSISTKITDLPTSIEIPDTDYAYFGAGLHFDLAVAERTMIGAGVHYMQLRSAGDVTNQDWYGSGTGYGYALETGFLLPLPASLYLRGTFGYRREHIDFDGSGAVTQMHGVWALDDSTLTGSATLGVAF